MSVSSSSGQTALEVKELSKSYGSSIGISNVSISVKRGTLHGFLGPNGAGKTTTMKCVMGLLRKTSGEIMIFGEELRGEGVQLREKIGYLPELPSYPAYLRGREVLETYGRIRGIVDHGKLLKESRDLLEVVGLAEAAEKPVGKYSRGMQTRLGLALALLGDPDLLLLDEPTEGLDPLAVIEVREMFRRLVSEGRTILLSSHQLSEVQQICSKVTVVNKGRTVAEGFVGDLTRKLHGGVSYKAEFNSLSQELLKVLKQMVGVLEITTLKEGTIRILISKDYDIRPDLARLAVEHGSLLLSCEREEVSLEELFISLVKESN
jgi:ABC-2 type transport system ATP-binding protein